MPGSSERPARGLTIQQAFEKWADPEDVAKLTEFADGRTYGLITVVHGGPPTAREIRQETYGRHEHRCTEALKRLLREGRVLASGISKTEENDDRRKVIHPSMWDVLEVHVFWEQISGTGRTYLKPEFFEPEALPLNVGAPPDWLAEYCDTRKIPIRFEADYSRVIVGDTIMPCGVKQSRILKALHKAALAGNPWCEGKRLLAASDAASANMRELFKHKKWRPIVESDGRGRYRLALPV